MQIYITGCARSGTTLLHRLFTSFADVVVIPGERRIDNYLVSVDESESTFIAKRVNIDWFSNTSHMAMKCATIKAVNEHEVRVINIVRDGRDVITGGWVSPKRWADSVQHFLEMTLYVDHTVFYEDLVRDPDKEQKRIVECYNLKPIYKFSDYPDFVPGWMYKANMNWNYKPRKISDSRVGKDLELYKLICDDTMQELFEKNLQNLGYML